MLVIFNILQIINFDVMIMVINKTRAITLIITLLILMAVNYRKKSIMFIAKRLSL